MRSQFLVLSQISLRGFIGNAIVSTLTLALSACNSGLSTGNAVSPETQTQSDSTATLAAIISQAVQGAAVEARNSQSSFGSIPILADIGAQCRDADATDFYSQFDGSTAGSRDLNVETLAAEAYQARVTAGFWEESQLPVDASLLAQILRHSAADNALGRWKTAQLGTAAIDASDSDIFALAVGWRAICQIAVRNEQLLGEYLRSEGFPSQQIVGRQGSSLAMHAFKHSAPESSPVAEYVSQAEQAFGRGEVTPTQYAMILDTHAYMQNRPLPFGTYVECQNGTPTISRPLEDAEHVEARRAEFGLNSLEDQLAHAAPFCAMVAHQ